MPRAPSQHYEMCRKLPARSDYKFKYSTPAPAVRSRRPSPLLHTIVLMPCTEREIDDAFAALSQLKAGGVVIGPDVFFNTRSEQLGALASRHGVAAIYQYRAFALAGGLMSYSGDIAESHRLAGGYTGQILKGEKPADLPVQQATKVELIINLKTAKALGLTIPLPLVGRA